MRRKGWSREEEWRSEEERWSREGGMEGVWRKGWGRGTKR